MRRLTSPRARDPDTWGCGGFAATANKPYLRYLPVNQKTGPDFMKAYAAAIVAAALATSLSARAAIEASDQKGEPLPASAPAQPYELAAWCYGAMSEYLDIYDKVKPDLRDIDKLFGSSVKNEKEPYAQDMAAARDELKVLASAVEAAEKASPRVIAPQGIEAVN